MKDERRRRYKKEKGIVPTNPNSLPRTPNECFRVSP